MGQKGHITDQKCTNKGPPLNGKSLCSKKLSGKGEYSPPLNGQIRQVVFDSLPKLLTKKLILPPVLNFVDCSRILINYLFVGFRALFYDF